VPTLIAAARSARPSDTAVDHRNRYAAAPTAMAEASGQPLIAKPTAPDSSRAANTSHAAGASAV